MLRPTTSRACAARSSLPPDTNDRIRRSLRSLGQFPRLGTALEGDEWAGFRFVLGPWRWMVIVYEVDEESDRVVVVTVQDGRASTQPPLTADASPTGTAAGRPTPAQLPAPSDRVCSLVLYGGNVLSSRVREGVAAREAATEQRVDELASLSAHLSAATARWLELVWEMHEQGDSSDLQALSGVALRDHGA